VVRNLAQRPPWRQVAKSGSPQKPRVGEKHLIRAVGLLIGPDFILGKGCQRRDRWSEYVMGAPDPQFNQFHLP
jgi:hypothetical protein